MTGFVAVSMVYNGEYRAPLDEYENILKQFKSDANTIEFVGIYGQPVCVDRASCESITWWSSESREAFERANPQESPS